MSDIIKADPASADNPSMVKMVIFLLGRLTDPEESIRQIDRALVEDGIPLNVEEEKIEEYRQFYPVFANTVREIESAVDAAKLHSSEVRPGSQTGYVSINLTLPWRKR